MLGIITTHASSKDKAVLNWTVSEKSHGPAGGYSLARQADRVADRRPQQKALDSILFNFADAHTKKITKIEGMPKGENQLIEWIASRVRRTGVAEVGGETVGIGDDMAIVSTGDGKMLIAADMLLDGVHFDTPKHAPELIGRKALAVNLSDCAAMAVRPRYVTVSVALPNHWDDSSATRLMDGLITLAEEFDCNLIGGDTNSWDKPLAIDVTILAEPYDTHVPICRSGAKAGDILFVTGDLGGSIAEKHLSFRPRVNEARELAALLKGDLHAMMDLSDGLATDAPRMAKASNIRMIFEKAALLSCASEAAKTQSANEEELLKHAIGDGEDFELFFAVAPESAGKVESIKIDCRITRVGEVIKGKDVLLRDNKDIKPLPEGGWQHFK